MRVLLVDLERAWRGGQSQALLLLRGLARARPRGGTGRGQRRGAGRARRSARASRFTPQRRKSAAGARRVLAAAPAARAALRHRPRQRSARAYGGMARASAPRTRRWSRRGAWPSRSRAATFRWRAIARRPAIVAISQAVREQLLAARLDPQRIAIVADGVEVPPPVSAEQRRSARERWNFAAGEQVLALVAPLTAEKGHALLLDAFAAMRREAPHCRLLLAGDGPLRAQLEEQARAAQLGSRRPIRGICRGRRFGLRRVRCVRLPVAQRRRGHLAAQRDGARLAGGGSGTRRRDGNCGERRERLARAGSLRRPRWPRRRCACSPIASWRGDWEKRRGKPSPQSFPPIAWWRRRSLSSSA